MLITDFGTEPAFDIESTIVILCDFMWMLFALGLMARTLFMAKGNLSKQQIYSSPRIGKSEYFDFMHIIPFAIPGQKTMLGKRLITGK